MYFKRKPVEAIAIVSLDNQVGRTAGKPLDMALTVEGRLDWTPQHEVGYALDLWSAAETTRDVIGGNVFNIGLAALVDGVWYDTDGGSFLSDDPDDSYNLGFEDLADELTICIDTGKIDADVARQAAETIAFLHEWQNKHRDDSFNQANTIKCLLDGYKRIIDNPYTRAIHVAEEMLAKYGAK